MNGLRMVMSGVTVTGMTLCGGAASPAGLDASRALEAERRVGVLVEVTRGPMVESRHHGHWVAVTPQGEIQMAVGNPRELVLSRSALKPLQALATVRLALERGLELSTEEIAMLCASHEAGAYHLEAVSRLLERSDATEEDLHCGPVAGSRLRHNCSGKHGGMMLLARLAEVPLEGYWRVEHAVQQRIQDAIREFTGYTEPLAWGIDGCGVPNYALSLQHLAVGYARLANPQSAPEPYRAAAEAIRQAILAHPGHLSSRESFDARLIAVGDGRWIGKSGAEACYGLGLSGGPGPAHPALGVAVKIDDGSARGMPQVLLAILDRLGAIPAELAPALEPDRTKPVLNSRGEVVGEIRAAVW